MPIRGEELLNAAELLAKEKNLKVAVKCSMAGGALAGLTTLTGGLLFGPVGLFIGGAGGGLIGYVASKDKFKPLHEIIANLPSGQRNQLIQHLNLALKDFDITDLMKLTSLVMTSSSLQEVLIKSLIGFAETELKLSVTQ